LDREASISFRSVEGQSIEPKTLNRAIFDPKRTRIADQRKINAYGDKTTQNLLGYYTSVLMKKDPISFQAN